MDFLLYIARILPCCSDGLGDGKRNNKPFKKGGEQNKNQYAVRYHGGLPMVIDTGTKSGKALIDATGLPGYCGAVERKKNVMGSIELELWPQFRIGGSLWPSGFLLAHFLKRTQKELNLPLKSKKVIELGAGPALPGLIAAKYLDVGEVTLTDYPELVPLMQKNVDLNGVGEVAVCQTLDWANCGDAEWVGVTSQADDCHTLAEEKTEFLRGRFDVVLGADIIYVEEQDPLIQALEVLLEEGREEEEEEERYRYRYRFPVFVLGYRERSDADREYLNKTVLPRFSQGLGFLYSSQNGFGKVVLDRRPEQLHPLIAAITESGILSGNDGNIDYSGSGIEAAVDDHDLQLGRSMGECEIYILAGFKKSS